MTDPDRKDTHSVASTGEAGSNSASINSGLASAFELAASAAHMDAVAASAMLGSANFLYNPGYSQLAAAAAFSGYGLGGFPMAAALNPAAQAFHGFSAASADPLSLAYAQSAAAYGLMPQNAAGGDWWRLAQEQSRRISDSASGSFSPTNLASSTANSFPMASPVAPISDKEPQESFSEVLAKLGQGLSSTTKQQQQQFLNSSAAAAAALCLKNAAVSNASLLAADSAAVTNLQLHQNNRKSSSSHATDLSRSSSDSLNKHGSRKHDDGHSKRSSHSSAFKHSSSSSERPASTLGASASTNSRIFRSPPPRCSSSLSATSSSGGGGEDGADVGGSGAVTSVGGLLRELPPTMYGKGGTSGRGRGRPPKLYSQKLAELSAQMEGLSESERLSLQLKLQLEAELRKHQDVRGLQPQQLASSRLSSSDSSVHATTGGGHKSSPGGGGINMSRTSASPAHTASDGSASVNGIPLKHSSSSQQSQAARSGRPKKASEHAAKSGGAGGSVHSSPASSVKDGQQSKAESSSGTVSSKKAAPDCSIEGTIEEVLKRFEESERNELYRAKLNSQEEGTKKRKNDDKNESVYLGCKKSRTAAVVEHGYKLPLSMGWKRETQVKGVGPGGILGEVIYITPCNKKLWNMDNVREYLNKASNNCPFSTDDFTFKSYVRLGDYYECNKASPSRQNYVKMNEKAIDELIGTMTSQAGAKRDMTPAPAHTHPETTTRTYPLSMEHNSSFSTYHDNKRHDTAQELAASEAKQRELMEKERKRQYAYMMNMERERQRQKAMFARVMEQQKLLEERMMKQQEKEAGKQKKLELKMIEMRVAHELKKSNEDMKLIDLKPHPDLTQIEGNKLSNRAFADCLMTIEFLHSFTEALSIDVDTIPTMGIFQGAFIDNNPACQECVSILLVELLKFGVCDPGIPSPRIVTQMLGLRLSDLEITLETMSNILRMFIVARNGIEDSMSDWMAKGRNYHSLTPDQRAALMGFVCNELLSSRLISGEIDRNIDQQAVHRREKWMIDGKIRRMRMLQARKFAVSTTPSNSIAKPCDGTTPIEPNTSSSVTPAIPSETISTNSSAAMLDAPAEGDGSRVVAEGNTTPSVAIVTPQATPIPVPTPTPMMHESASSVLGGGDDDSDNESVDTHMTSNWSGDEEDITTSDEMERRIERLTSQANSKQQAVTDCGYRLRHLHLGQDRFRRNFFVLGKTGGIYVEGMNDNEEDKDFDADTFVKELRQRKESAAKGKNNLKVSMSSSPIKKEVKLEPMDVLTESEAEENKSFANESMQQEESLFDSTENNTTLEISINHLDVKTENLKDCKREEPLEKEETIKENGLEIPSVQNCTSPETETVEEPIEDAIVEDAPCSSAVSPSIEKSVVEEFPKQAETLNSDLDNLTTVISNPDVEEENVEKEKLDDTKEVDGSKSPSSPPTSNGTKPLVNGVHEDSPEESADELIKSVPNDVKDNDAEELSESLKPVVNDKLTEKDNKCKENSKPLSPLVENNCVNKKQSDLLPEINSIDKKSTEESKSANNNIDEDPDSATTFHDFLNGCIQTCFEHCRKDDGKNHLAGKEIERFFGGCLDLTNKPTLLNSKHSSPTDATIGGTSQFNPDEPLDLTLKQDDEIFEGKNAGKLSSLTTNHTAFRQPLQAPPKSRSTSSPSPETNGKSESLQKLPVDSSGKFDDSLLTNAALIYATHASVMCPGIPISQLQQFYKDQLVKALEDHSSNNSSTESVRAWMSFYQSLLQGGMGGTAIPGGIFMDMKTEPLSDRGTPEPPSITEEELNQAVQQEIVEKGHELMKPESIPAEFKGRWWRIHDEVVLQQLQGVLAQRGIRERNLQKNIVRFDELVLPSLSSDGMPSMDFSIPAKPPRFKVRSKRGKGRGLRRDPSTSILTEIGEEAATDEAFVAECTILEEMEALEDRVLNASLQCKGWQAPLKIIDDDTIHLIARSVKKKSRFEYYPLDLAKERLLSLEMHMERRYLLPPLNKEPQLDVVEGAGSTTSGSTRTTQTSTAAAAAAMAAALEDKSRDSCSVAMDTDDDAMSTGGSGGGGRPQRLRRQEAEIEDEDNLPLGLIQWRQSVSKAAVVEQLRTAVDQLVRAVAWDKSIMKVLCQICRKDNNEAQLLLCDGCDRGYHTYCFRPPISQIPSGDWFCYDCVSKATGKRHCFVCGQVADATMRGAVCDICCRMVHMECTKPPMTRIPRKWLCSVCTECAGGRQQGPSKKTPAAKRCKQQTGGATTTPGGKVRRVSHDVAGASNDGTLSISFDSMPAPDCKTPMSPGMETPLRIAAEGTDSSMCSVDSRPTSLKRARVTDSSVEVNTASNSASSSITVEVKESDLRMCRILLSELLEQESSWPFLKPVNAKQVPFYKKVIKRPMDFSTIKKRIGENNYKNKEDFIVDVRLVFNNCEIFNEDDSEIGKAGHKLRAFFESRLLELENSPIDLLSPISSSISIVNTDNLTATADITQNKIPVAITEALNNQNIPTFLSSITNICTVETEKCVPQEDPPNSELESPTLPELPLQTSPNLSETIMSLPPTNKHSPTIASQLESTSC